MTGKEQTGRAEAVAKGVIFVERAVAVTSEVDELLAAVGLKHGRRGTFKGTWSAGQRLPRKNTVASRKLRNPSSRRLKANDCIEVVHAPGWEQHQWLRHGFSTRAGGVSTIYSGDSGRGDLNLGWTKEDDPAYVAENRRRFVAAVAGAPAQLVGLRQVHSGLVRIIEHDVEGGEAGLREQTVASPLQTTEARPVLRGDGLMTDVPGVMLGVGVADCVPVLVADLKQRAVAAFHAGWRGTLARIVERGIGTMRLHYGSLPADLIAVVGPSIGACCYSVGEEVQFEFESQFAYSSDLFSEVYDSDPVREKYPLLFLTARAPGHSNIGPQIHLDLWEANRRQLLDAGVPAKHITVVGECTGCAWSSGGGRRKYFSHRADSSFAGRMMGVIGIAG